MVFVGMGADDNIQVLYTKIMEEIGELLFGRTGTCIDQNIEGGAVLLFQTDEFTVALSNIDKIYLCFFPATTQTPYMRWHPR